MRRVPVSMSRTAFVLTSACLALAVLPGVGLSQPDPDPAPDEQSAPAQPGLCEDGALCAWPDASYTGSVTEFGDTSVAGCQELARPAQSAINDSGRTAVFYASSGCAGGVVIGVEPGRKAPKFPPAASVRFRSAGIPQGDTGAAPLDDSGAAASPPSEPASSP